VDTLTVSSHIAQQVFGGGSVLHIIAKNLMGYDKYRSR